MTPDRGPLDPERLGRRGLPDRPPGSPRSGRPGRPAVPLLAGGALPAGALTVLLAGGLTAGCARAPSVFLAGGQPAARMAVLGWLITAAAALVLVLVTAALLYATLVDRERERDAGGGRADARPPATPSGGATRVMAIAGVGTVAVLLGLFLVSILELSAVAEPERGGRALTVEVIGHRWWWEIRYPDRDGGPAAVTANEMHVPVGRTVRIEATAAELIHSLWVPRLAGKTDLIPGQYNVSWLRAERPGVYRGQCAEYCGVQHANMALHVVAEPPDAFAAWLENLRRPAVEPRTELEREGREAFMGSACVGCHTIRGTRATGDVGPDLTHIGSRGTLAAGTFPNRRGYLEAWIVDAQELKPGALMPNQDDLDGRALRAVAAYLESLR